MPTNVRSADSMPASADRYAVVISPRQELVPVITRSERQQSARERCQEKQPAHLHTSCRQVRQDCVTTSAKRPTADQLVAHYFRASTPGGTAARGPVGRTVVLSTVRRTRGPNEFPVLGARPRAPRGWCEGTPPHRQRRVTRPAGVARQRPRPYSRRAGRSAVPWYATPAAPARAVHRRPGDPVPAGQSRPLDPERPQRTGGRAPRTRRSSRGQPYHAPPCRPPQAGEG